MNGVGLGLRPKHYSNYLSGGAAAPWAEAITENFLGFGGRPRAVLERVREDAELILHGVSLSVGACDPMNGRYLRELAALRRDVGAAIVSDHLCFASVAGNYGHDLWPLPLTEESLKHVCSRIAHAQEILGCPLVLENPSTYLEWNASTVFEPEFMNAMAEHTGCGLLIDINNIVVSSHNHDASPALYLQTLNPQYVTYYHLAGHEEERGMLLDTHIGPLPNNVMKLYEMALEQLGPRPTIVEWDGDVPALEVVMAEVHRAAAMQTRIEWIDSKHLGVAPCLHP